MIRRHPDHLGRGLRRLAPHWFAVAAIAWVAALALAETPRALVTLRPWLDLLSTADRSQKARVEAAIGLTPADERSLRDYFQDDGMFVVYYPIATLPVEHRRTIAERVELLAQGARNLLYPHPRDMRYCLDNDALRSALDPRFEHRLILADLSLGAAPPPVDAEFDFFAERNFGPHRVRFWSLRRAPPR